MKKRDAELLAKMLDEYGLRLILNELADLLDKKAAAGQALIEADGFEMSPDEEAAAAKNLRGDMF